MKRILLIALFSAATICGYAFSIESTRFHCADDTIKINQMLRDAVADGKLRSPGDYMSFFADKMLGTPYVAHTLEGEREYLTINVDQIDCTTFVETLMALTKAAMAKSPTWYTFASKLEGIRYRSGQLNGYASRLHYVSAWIVENTARGNLREITSGVEQSEYQTKSLNYMSAHRDSYPALSDSATFAAVKSFEAGYNMHRFPFINKRHLRKKEFLETIEDGDIICLVTKTDGLDVSHMGIVRFVDGRPHLLHASSTNKEVIIDKYDLFEMLRPLRNNLGIRVLRLSDSF